MRRILVGSVAVAGLVITMAAGPARAGQGSGPPSADGPSSRSSNARTVRLPTGERVRYWTTAGRPHVVVTPTSRHGVDAVHAVEEIAGHLYVFPGAALRYLGRFLDPGLFDLTRPASTIRIGYDGAVAPQVAGVAITGHRPGRAEGYVKDAAAFGRALAAQWRRDARPGAPAPTSLLGATYLGTTSPGTARPAYPQATVVLKVLDPQGKAVPSGSVVLMNTDDAHRFDSLVPISNGTGRASVPLGHYSAFTEVDTYNPTTGTAAFYLVPVMDYDITANLQTLVLDAQTATTTPTVHPPRPAQRTDLGLGYTRFAVTGERFTARLSLAGADSVARIVPAPAPTVGRMELLTEWELDGGRYTYSLGYRDVAGIPADQSRRVRTAELATVNAAYYADHPGQAETHLRSLTDLGTSPQPLTAPLRRREYVLSPPGATWTETLYARPTDDNPYGGEVDDGWRTYEAGSVRDVDWLRGLLAPGIVDRTNGDPGFSCYWCRTDSSLAVLLTPVIDTTPGHGGYLDLSTDNSPVARYRLYRDGVLLDDEYDVTGTTVAVPAARATYRVIDQVNRLGFSHDSAATVDVTFVSAAGQGGALPAEWDCGLLGSGSDCTVLPMLRVAAPLPTTMSGTMPIGPHFATFTIDHVPGAAAVPITSVDVQLSADNGKTYRRAWTVPLGNGRYQVLLLNPRGWIGHAVKIKINATDAAGGVITETVAAAYTVTAS